MIQHILIVPLIYLCISWNTGNKKINLYFWDFVLRLYLFKILFIFIHGLRLFCYHHETFGYVINNS